MATRTISAAGGNWNSTSTWDEGVVPTSADDVVARGDGTSATTAQLTINVTAACRSFDCTNLSDHGHSAIAINAVSLSIGTTSTGPSGLALKFVNGMTLALNTNATIRFISTVSGNTITTAGLGMPLCQFRSGNSATVYTLQDAWTSASGKGIELWNGTLDFNGQTVTTDHITSVNNGSRTLTTGSATININGTGTPWDFSTSASQTVNASGSTINLSGAGVTFAGGGFTYATVNLTGTGVATVTGANTFTTLSRSNAAAVTLTLPASTTTTATTFTVNGSSGNLVTLNSSSSGTAATISVASGTVRADFTSIKDSTATGGATFIATSNSTNVSGNTGWTFRSVQSGTGESDGVSSTSGAGIETYGAAGTTTGTSTTTGAGRALYGAVGRTDGAGTTTGLAVVLHVAGGQTDGRGTTNGFGSGRDQLRYASLTPTFDDQRIYNEVSLSREGGSPQVAKNAASIAAYLKRQLSKSGLSMSSDNVARSLANWILGLYKQPFLRFEEMRVEPQRDPQAHFPVVLARDIGDRITVHRRPQGIGQPMIQDVHIQGITHTADASKRHWTVTYQMSPVNTLSVFIIGKSLIDGTDVLAP